MATSTAPPATAGFSHGGPQANVPSTHPYTCNTCQVAFRNGDSQRGHMRSDWHRYNLKRRVASLPPLSSEVFADKVLTAQASSTAAAARASFERTCDVCQKTYYSENAFQNHIGSQKHKLRLAVSQAGAAEGQDNEANLMAGSTFSLNQSVEAHDSMDETDADADAEFSEVIHAIKASSISEAEPLSRRPTRPHHSADEDRSSHPISKTTTASSTGPSLQAAVNPTSGTDISICLFCNYSSPSLPLNVSHMGKIHGMFIPEQRYLTDLPGLVGYLREKVFEDHECLYCGKIKGTTSGLQTHMRDKGHCMIAFDSESQMIEVGQFYDFRSTYSDDEDDDNEEGKDDLLDGKSADEKSSGGKKPTARGQNDASATTAGGEGDEADGDGWETDSSASSLDSAELTSVPVDHRHQYQRLDKHPHHSHNDPRPHHCRDGWHSHAHIHPHAVYYDEYELHLPSGRSVGHRSLARYYRQNLHNHPGPSSSTAAIVPAITDGSSSTGDIVAQDDNDDERGRHRQVTTRANSGQGMLGVTDDKKREAKAVETRERKREQRQRTRYQWGVEKKGNHQKHFRDPLLQ